MQGHEVPIHLLGTPLSCVTRHDRYKSIYTYSGFADQDLWCCLHHFPVQNLVVQKHKIWCKNWYVNVIFNIFKVLGNEGERLLGSFHFSFVFLIAQDSAKIKLPLNVMLCKEFMDLLFFLNSLQPLWSSQKHWRIVWIDFSLSPFTNNESLQAG